MIGLTEVQTAQMLTGTLEFYVVQTDISILPEVTREDDEKEYFHQARIWEEVVQLIRQHANVVIVGHLTVLGFSFAVEHQTQVNVEELRNQLRNLGEMSFSIYDNSTVDLSNINVVHLEGFELAIDLLFNELGSGVSVLHSKDYSNVNLRTLEGLGNVSVDISMDDETLQVSYDDSDIIEEMERLDQQHLDHLASTTAHDAVEIVFDNTNVDLPQSNLQTTIEQLTDYSGARYGGMSITDNSTAISVLASPDPTLQDPVGYNQILNIWDAVTVGHLNGVTKQQDTFTILRSGWYKIHFWGTLTSNVNNTNVGVKFAVNGIITLGRRPRARIGSGGDRVSMSAHGIHYFEANDVVSLWFSSDLNAEITWEDALLTVNELRSDL